MFLKHIFSILVLYAPLFLSLKVEKDGGYTDIIVSLLPGLNSSDSESIISGIYDTFNETSSALFDATDGKFYLKNFVVILPSSWSDNLIISQLSKIYNVTSNDVLSTSSPDIKVNITSNEVYRNQPYTYQAKSCGLPGGYLHVTSDFLLNDTTSVQDKGKILLQQWVKLRFGVYEEFGFDGDNLYPKFYVGTNTEVKPSSCTNVPLIGAITNGTDGVCQNGDIQSVLNSSCDFEVFPDENEDVTSSLMYNSILPSMTSFCDSKTHDIEAPTKQNFLCNLKSVKEVITSSEDHQQVENPIPVKVDPEIRLVMPQYGLNFIFGSDISQKRFLKARASVTKLAVDQFLQVSNIHVSQDKFFVYSNTTALVSRIDEFKVEIDSSNDGCQLCAFREAITLSKKAKTRNFVIVTDGTFRPDEYMEIQKLLSTYKLKVYAILYPFVGGIQEWSKISEKVFTIDEDGLLSTLGQLQKSLLGIRTHIKPYNVPGISASIQTGEANESGKITLTEDVKKIYIISKESPDKSVIKSSDKLYRYDYVVSRPFFIIEIPNRKNNKLWTYTIPVEFSIVIFSETESDITASTWTNIQDGFVKGEQPITIYAEFLKHNSPVLDAHITAVIENTVNSTYSKTYSVVLKDDGRGSPDETSGDGIYSNYLLYNIPEKTVVKMSISYGSSNRTSIGVQTNCAGGNCFGSTVKYAETAPYRTQFFIDTGSLEITESVNIDKFPPSRIIDLKIEQNIDDLGQFKISWTSAGAIFDRGQADEYQYRFSLNRSEVLTQETPWLKMVKLAPSPAGSRESFIANIPSANGTYFVVIRSKNDEGKFSRSSNVVVLNYIPVTETTTTEMPTTTTSETTKTTTTRSITNPANTTDLINTTTAKSEKSADKKSTLSNVNYTLIIALGAVILLLVVILAGLCCFYRIRKTKRNKSLKIEPQQMHYVKKDNDGLDNEGFSNKNEVIRENGSQTAVIPIENEYSGIRESVNGLYAEIQPKNSVDISKRSLPEVPTITDQAIEDLYTKPIPKLLRNSSKKSDEKSAFSKQRDEIKSSVF